MKRYADALPDGFVSGAARLGMNKARVARGQKPLARGHLPFNRRRPTFGQREVEAIADAARIVGFDREQQFQIRRFLYDVRRKEADEAKEEFMLHFNAAYDRALALIWEAYDRGELRTPRTCQQVYTTICQACAPRSATAPIGRRELAEKLRLSEREVSRHTAQLERLDLLRTDPDGRCVTYVVLPVEQHGFPLWHGDRIAMRDAAADARDQLDRERQLALV